MAPENRPSQKERSPNILQINTQNGGLFAQCISPLPNIASFWVIWIPKHGVNRQRIPCCTRMHVVLTWQKSHEKDFHQGPLIKRIQRHFWLFCSIQERAPKLKCLGGKSECKSWWVRLYMFKVAGTREYFDYVLMYVFCRLLGCQCGSASFLLSRMFLVLDLWYPMIGWGCTMVYVIVRLYRSLLLFRSL